MSTYLDEVKTQKKFTGNVVIQIRDVYFAIREPDSGLNIEYPYSKSVIALNLNPTTIDVRKVTTSISSFSFRILDKDDIVTSLIGGDAADYYGQEVRIWLGRSGVGMDFADYFELPITYVNKLDHPDNTYTFNTSEQTERMNRPIYEFNSALGVDILAATTIWTMRDDITGFPTSGFLKCENEFVSYTGIDTVNNRFTGVIRGELNSVPVDHEANNDVFFVETVSDNPLTILLQLLISGGGGGVYDVLQSGLAIDESLIDIDEIEQLRDAHFPDLEFTLSIYDIDSALKYIENEILAPCNLRFTTSLNSKVTVVELNRAVFVAEDDTIDEDTIRKYPKWSLDGTKVTNVIEVLWDYSEGTGLWGSRSRFTDQDSIVAYGAKTPLKYQFTGVKTSLDGSNFVEDFGSRMLARLAFPTPEISINTHLDRSLQNVGAKTRLVSSKIPSVDGSLNFESELEIISRSINQTTSDVTFKLAFTSFTNMRSGFIAPSDLITGFTTQKRIAIAGGRYSKYTVGWYMRLWDEVNQVYLADDPNPIAEIIPAGEGNSSLVTEDGDSIITEGGDSIILEQEDTDDMLIFENNFTTPLSENYRLRFANYDDVIASQKRYCFISDLGNDFSDGKPTYKVTY